MTQGHLRRNRRWTEGELAEATARLERAFAKKPVAEILGAKRGGDVIPLTIAEPPMTPIHGPPAGITPNSDPFGGFSFTLPWAPSVNNAFANSNKGGRRKTQGVRLYAEAVSAALLAQRIPCVYRSHPMAITIIQHASADRGDIDNGIKVALDCLKRFGVIADDNRKIVKRICVEDGYRVERGQEFIEVKISCVTAWGSETAFAGESLTYFGGK